MIVCTKCQIEMRPVKNGFLAVSMSSFGRYQLFSSDKWACAGCGAEVLLLANGPMGEHIQPGFAETCETLHPLEFWQDRKAKMEGASK